MGVDVGIDICVQNTGKRENSSARSICRLPRLNVFTVDKVKGAPPSLYGDACCWGYSCSTWRGTTQLYNTVVLMLKDQEHETKLVKI
jgi:hypothetical protein